VTPGTGAADWSLTVPTIDPYKACARAGGAVMAAASAAGVPDAGSQDDPVAGRVALVAGSPPGRNRRFINYHVSFLIPWMECRINRKPTKDPGKKMIPPGRD
jgi:hypothetical protein